VVDVEVDGAEGFTEGGVADPVDAKEVSKSENPQANLSVNVGREVLTRITNSCPSVKRNELGHPFDKSASKVFNITGSKVDML